MFADNAVLGRNMFGRVMLAAIAMTLALRADTVRGADDAIAPFVDGETIFVARLDVAKADMKAAEQWVLNAVGSFPGIGPQEVAAAKQQIPKDMETARQWLADVQQAGGHHIYIVLGMHDIPQNGPAVVIPVDKGGNVDAVVKLLNSGRPEQPAGNDGFGGDEKGEHAAAIGNAAVLAEGTALRRMRDMAKDGKHAPRPELADAFAAAGDAAVCAALIPNDTARQEMEKILTALPPQVGGGEAKILTRGVSWVAVGGKGPPGEKLDIIVKCTDADAAKALADSMNKGLEFLKTDASIAQMIPSAPKVAKTIEPKVTADKIALSIDSEGVSTMFMGFFAVRMNTGPRVVAPAAVKPDDKGGL